MKLPTLLALGLALIVPGSAFAAKTYDQLVKVDKKAQSVTLSEGTHSKTYTVTSSTRIFINNKAGTFAGLKPGMKLSVTHASGSMTADFISATSPVHRRHRRR